MPLNFYATFTNGTNNGVTGLTPLISVTRIALSSGTQSSLFTAATMSAVTNCSGGYFYNMTASADLTAFDYFASITTNSTVSADTTYAASLWSEFGVQASVSIDNATSTRNSNLVSINGSSAAASALAYFDTRSINTTTRVISAFISDSGLQQLWEWPLAQIGYDPTDPPASQSVGGVLIQALTLWSLNATYNAVFTAASLANVPNSTTSALIQFTTSGSNHFVQTDVQMLLSQNNQGVSGINSIGQYYFSNSSTLPGVATVVDPTSIDTTLSGTHGAGSWESTGFSFSGAYTRSFHVQDTQTNSLQSATVRIQYNSDAEYHVTPVSGNFTTSLDALVYGLNATCPGYQGYSNTLTVSGDGSFTIVMTPVSISPPANPNVTRVYFFLYNSAGTVMVGSSVTWQINTPPYNVGQQPPASISDVNGLVYADVPRGITLQPTTPLGLQKEFTVPSDAGSTLEYAP